VSPSPHSHPRTLPPPLYLSYPALPPPLPQRFVYTFAKDVRASDMPPLMTPQEWNRELDERVRDTSFDPPVLSRPEVVDGFAGLVTHVARRQGEVADAGKRARVRWGRAGASGRCRDACGSAAAVVMRAAERAQ